MHLHHSMNRLILTLPNSNKKNHSKIIYSQCIVYRKNSLSITAASADDSSPVAAALLSLAAAQRFAEWLLPTLAADLAPNCALAQSDGHGHGHGRLRALRLQLGLGDAALAALLHETALAQRKLTLLDVSLNQCGVFASRALLRFDTLVGLFPFLLSFYFSFLFTFFYVLENSKI